MILCMPMGTVQQCFLIWQVQSWGAAGSGSHMDIVPVVEIRDPSFIIRIRRRLPVGKRWENGCMLEENSGFFQMEENWRHIGSGKI